MKEVFELFSITAKKFSHHVCLQDIHTQLTYQEVYALVEVKSRQLKAEGICPGQVVPIEAVKCIESIITILAILKIGAVYLPIDPKSPEERKKFIKIDVKNLIDEELGCILYTSGSTGRPKGVMITKRAIIEFSQWAAKEVNLNDSDVVVSVAPLFFDLSLFDLFATFYVGAKLVIPQTSHIVAPASFFELLKKYQVTTWYSVPTFYQQLLPVFQHADLSQLRLNKIIFAGEVFSHEKLLTLRSLFSQVRMWNWYGPTETNVVTSYEVPQTPPSPLPLGKATCFANVWLSDEQEIMVESTTLMKGYVGQELASSIYATGDVGKIKEGLFYFLGRKTEDRQVKIRGHRIELDEIKNVLLSCKEVLNAQVLVEESLQGEKKLLAAVCLNNSDSKTQIIKQMKNVLPNYMIPEEIIELSFFPTTQSGKTDLLALRSQVLEQCPGLRA